MASCSSEVTQSIYHACAKWRFEKQQQKGIGVGIEEENMTIATFQSVQQQKVLVDPNADEISLASQPTSAPCGSELARGTNMKSVFSCRSMQSTGEYIGLLGGVCCQHKH